MVAENQTPPNQPRAFCAPCAKKIMPRIRRRMVMVGSSVVLMSLRNTGTPPLLFRRENQDLRKRRCYTDSAGWWTRKRQTGGSGRFGSCIGNDSASGREGGRLRGSDKAHDPILSQSRSEVGVAVTALRIPDPRRRRLGGNELSLACHSTR